MELGPLNRSQFRPQITNLLSKTVDFPPILCCTPPTNGDRQLCFVNLTELTKCASPTPPGVTGVPPPPNLRNANCPLSFPKSCAYPCSTNQNFDMQMSRLLAGAPISKKLSHVFAICHGNEPPPHPNPPQIKTVIDSLWHCAANVRGRLQDAGSYFKGLDGRQEEYMAAQCRFTEGGGGLEPRSLLPRLWGQTTSLQLHQSGGCVYIQGTGSNTCNSETGC